MKRNERTDIASIIRVPFQRVRGRISPFEARPRPRVDGDVFTNRVWDFDEAATEMCRQIGNVMARNGRGRRARKWDGQSHRTGDNDTQSNRTCSPSRTGKQELVNDEREVTRETIGKDDAVCFVRTMWRTSGKVDHSWSHLSKNGKNIL
jgi:hypothetical protein